MLIGGKRVPPPDTRFPLFYAQFYADEWSGLPIACRKGVTRGIDNEGAADWGVGKSRAGPRTQVARQKRYAGHSGCSRAVGFERGSRVHRGVRSGPREVDGD